VQPWRNRWHLKYRIPVSAGEERLRVQFHASEGKPYFSVEARYEHPKETLEDIETVSAALRSLAFGVGNDGWGHFWAKVTPAFAVLDGASTVDRMIEHASATIDALVDSGLIEALAERTPSTSTPPAPPVDE
jgi:hypothetical protein